MARDGDGLRAQDRPVFAHVLQQALDSPEIRAALRDASVTVRPEWLRAQALRDREVIAEMAVVEYRVYLRASAVAESDSDGGVSDPSASWRDGEQVTSARAELLSALTFFIPALSAVAAAAFLLIGHSLELVGLHPLLADELQTWGWGFALVAGAGAAVVLARLLMAAAHNTPAAMAEPAADAFDRARREQAVWRQALLERGVLPYLRRRIGEERRAASDTETRR
ncbi:hypothetical protein [Streptomyces sp. CBMA152]|uniref:hypothetical protein n=1 Tax=Streptomyces sp. CBMA152 TaxID=1896312 RepID=UPI00166169FE|nr:hypothetical protein [Streptomyces sp. CBMA152]MBD0741073.1 hypothetical protein [Streptomyces sp. CBMA152]